LALEGERVGDGRGGEGRRGVLENRDIDLDGGVCEALKPGFFAEGGFSGEGGGEGCVMERKDLALWFG